MPCDVKCSGPESALELTFKAFQGNMIFISTQILIIQIIFLCFSSTSSCHVCDSVGLHTLTVYNGFLSF